jgi:hypothetical protein
MKIEKKIFGKDIEDYFCSDADGLESYRNGEIYCLIVELDTVKKTAVYNTQNEQEFCSNSCNSITQEDDYEAVFDFLSQELKKDGYTITENEDCE